MEATVGFEPTTYGDFAGRSLEPDLATLPFSSVLSLLARLAWHFFHHIISPFVFFWRYAKYTFWWAIQGVEPGPLGLQPSASTELAYDP